MRMFCSLLSLLSLTTGLRADDFPLPEGAVARLGTTRYRLARAFYDSVVFAGDGSRVAHVDRGVVTVLDLATGRVAYRLTPEDRLTKVREPRQRADYGPFVAFTPDAKQLFVGYADRVDVRDAASGKSVKVVPLPRKTPDGDDVPPELAGIHPCTRSGTLLVWAGTGCFELDPAGWTWTYRAAIGDDVIAYSGDGRRVVTFYGVEALFQQCEVVETAGGKHLKTVGVPGGAGTAALSADGRLVAAGSEQIRIVDLATGRETTPAGKLAFDKVLLGGYVRQLAFSPDAKTLFAAADEPWAVARWDVATGKRLADIPTGFGRVQFAVTTDGQRLVTVGSDEVVRRFELPSGKEIPGADGFSGVTAVAITPDGSAAAVGDLAGVLRVWAAPFTGEPRTISTGGERVDDLAFSADGKTLLLARGDYTVVLWDVATGKERAVLRPPVPPKEQFYPTPLRLGASPDGTRIAATAAYLATWVWDAGTGKVLWERRAEPDGTGDSVTYARPLFARDGKTLFLGHNMATVGRYDPDTGKPGSRIPLPDTARSRWTVDVMALSPDGRYLLAESCYNDGHLFLIDLTSDRAVWRHDFDAKIAVRTAAFMPHGRTLVLGHSDGRVRTWNAATGQAVERFRNPPEAVKDITLSADGRRAVSVAPAATALVWELRPRE
jgi:WD40 repeat protein